MEDEKVRSEPAKCQDISKRDKGEYEEGAVLDQVPGVSLRQAWAPALRVLDPQTEYLLADRRLPG